MITYWIKGELFIRLELEHTGFFVVKQEDIIAIEEQTTGSVVYSKHTESWVTQTNFFDLSVYLQKNLSSPFPIDTDGEAGFKRASINPTCIESIHNYKEGCYISLNGVDFVSTLPLEQLIISFNI